MEAAAITERGGSPPSDARPPQGRRRAGTGPDRVSVIIFSLAAFLVVLALLSWELRAGSTRSAAVRPVVIVRRVYQTTVVETIRGGGASGNSVSQSVSSSGSASLPAVAPTTRASASR